MRALPEKQPKESQTESLLLVLTLLKYANVIYFNDISGISTTKKC